MWNCLKSTTALRLELFDTLSNTTTLNRVQGALASLLNAIIPTRVRTTAQYQFTSENTITGRINNAFFGVNDETYVQLDPYQKIKTFRINNIEFRRVANEAQETTNHE